MLRALMAASVAVTMTVAPARAAEEINFGIISTEASSNLKKIWDPFLADMEKGTGLKVNAFFASDYAGVIEGMRFKKVQLAWFGNKSAMEAVDRAEGEVFAQTVAANGQDGYYSHVIVHKDSPFQKLEDVLKCDKSLDFGIGDPEFDLWLPGADDVRVLGSQHRPQAVLQDGPRRQSRGQRPGGRQQAGARGCQQQREPRAPGEDLAEKAKEIRVIWTSPLIPSDPLVWRKDLDAGLKKKIGDWLFAYGKTDAEKKRPGRPAVGALQEVRQQPAAADPADGAQQGDHEAQGRREDRCRRQDGEARRAREAVRRGRSPD